MGAGAWAEGFSGSSFLRACLRVGGDAQCLLEARSLGLGLNVSTPRP